MTKQHEPGDLSPYKLIYEQNKVVWDQEVEYAEVLRKRRQFYLLGLAGVTSLSVFQMTPLIEGPAVHTVTNHLIQRLMLTCIVVSVGFMGWAIRYLFAGRGKSEGEQSIEKQLSKHYGKPRTIRRASEIIKLSRKEEAAAVAKENSSAAVWYLRSLKIKIATRYLAHANRRVSGMLRRGSFLIASSYICLGLAAVLYIIGVTYR
jgi:multisubunit Na+/H+ antiporter MnhC subunit